MTRNSPYSVIADISYAAGNYARQRIYSQCCTGRRDLLLSSGVDSTHQRWWLYGCQCSNWESRNSVREVVMTSYRGLVRRQGRFENTARCEVAQESRRIGPPVICGQHPAKYQQIHQPRMLFHVSLSVYHSELLGNYYHNISRMYYVIFHNGGPLISKWRLYDN